MLACVYVPSADGGGGGFGHFPPNPARELPERPRGFSPSGMGRYGTPHTVSGFQKSGLLRKLTPFFCPSTPRLHCTLADTGA